MVETLIPASLGNWIGDEVRVSEGQKWLDKLNPADETLLWRIARSEAAEVEAAVVMAQSAQVAWGRKPAVERGEILFSVTARLQARREEMARIVHLETGKSMKDALGETDGAVAQGRFMAGEGQRLYGRTCTSRMANRMSMTIRRPVGVAGLIVPANTPIANLAWKIFPALICGNACVVKAAEDTPATALLFAQIAAEAGLPKGLLSVVQGLGPECGMPLVEHPGVGVLSFTGSTAVGRLIGERAGRRLAKVSLELGGKNPLVVCDDADLDNAVRWTVLSAFSNAGQRCASASRVLVFQSIYEEFRDRLVAAARAQRVGIADSDDYGPVINSRQLDGLVQAVETGRREGARILCGGKRLERPGYFFEPTVVECATSGQALWDKELFGPLTCLRSVASFAEAVEVANASDYGLTACIHTSSLHRAQEFIQSVQAGVVVVNAGTFGSEPHMPFGGMKASGNGTREPGTEALDIYSELSDLYIHSDPARV